jgi:hypothetical protein
MFKFYYIHVYSLVDCAVWPLGARRPFSPENASFSRPVVLLHGLPTGL